MINNICSLNLGGLGGPLVFSPYQHGLFEHQIFRQIPLPYLSGKNAAPPVPHSRDPKPPGQQTNDLHQRPVRTGKTHERSSSRCANLVHSVLLYSKLASIAVRGFGSVFLLLHLLVLHSHPVSELCNAANAQTLSSGCSSQTLEGPSKSKCLCSN